MIKFVNAKINIGLNIVSRREDGYHNLETVFFPVGLESGMPQQPDPFDDILEANLQPGQPTGCRFQFMGRRVDCPPQKNLVVKATTLFMSSYFDKFMPDGNLGQIQLTLDKHLPDGAGLGGGSADASFTLMALNEMMEYPFTRDELMALALKLGADCPFFIDNTPCFAEGVGEILHPIDLDLTGYSLLLCKPDVHISTKEAFAGIHPRHPEFDLRNLAYLPVPEWRGKVVNDFEESVFPQHPELAELKVGLYYAGAAYASMSGSGSTVYGLFADGEQAKCLASDLGSTLEGVWLFRL